MLKIPNLANRTSLFLLPLQQFNQGRGNGKYDISSLWKRIRLGKHSAFLSVDIWDAPEFCWQSYWGLTWFSFVMCCVSSPENEALESPFWLGISDVILLLGIWLTQSNLVLSSGSLPRSKHGTGISQNLSSCSLFAHFLIPRLYDHLWLRSHFLPSQPPSLLLMLPIFTLFLCRTWQILDKSYPTPHTDISLGLRDPCEPAMSGSDSELHVGMRFNRQERGSVLGYPCSDALFWTISGMILTLVSLRFKLAAQVIPMDSRWFSGIPLDIATNLIPHAISDPHAMAQFPRRVQLNSDNRRDSCASSTAEFHTSSLFPFSLSISLSLLSLNLASWLCQYLSRLHLPLCANVTALVQDQSFFSGLWHLGPRVQEPC